jgi:hypothetical protein
MLIRPTKAPAFTISPVLSKPVLMAIALGGVDIGSIIALLADIATTKPRISISMPATAPEVTKDIAIGVSNVAVTVFEMKFEITIPHIAKTAKRTVPGNIVQLIRLINHSARASRFHYNS